MAGAREHGVDARGIAERGEGVRVERERGRDAVAGATPRSRSTPRRARVCTIPPPPPRDCALSLVVGTSTPRGARSRGPHTSRSLYPSA